MTNLDERKRKLLKPPEVKPVWTLMLMAVCMVMVGDAKYQWAHQHSLMPQKFMSAYQAGDWMVMASMLAMATFAQLTVWSFLINILFFWIFGSTVEKRLIGWRFPTFILSGMVISWAILSYDSLLTTSTTFIGPIMLLCYMLGGYLVFRPRKPFKPAEWKPPAWKIFKDDALKEANAIKFPYVSPMLYVILFAVYVFVAQQILTLSHQKIVDLTGMGWIGSLHRSLVGDLSPGAFALCTPVAAIESLIAGYIMANALIAIVFKRRSKREATDLQVQTFLQYKELRALDMNHKQAVEGAARLIGVPEDVAKDWIMQGLAPTKETTET